MTLVDQWLAIESGLPAGFASAGLLLILEDEARAARAAALLAPAVSARSGREVRFSSAPAGIGGASPTVLRRLLERLDEEGTRGSLALADRPEVEAPRAPQPPPTLAAAWDGALAALPADWSDLLAELELRSTDYLDRAALLAAPVNPSRFDERPAFRFRCARRFGYGVSPGMARRCLERLDAESIRGDVRVLRALSDTRPVGTQGPVWYVGGKAV